MQTPKQFGKLSDFWTLNHDYSSIPTLLDGDGSTTVESSSVKLVWITSHLLQWHLSSSNRCNLRSRLHIWFPLSKSLPCSASLYRKSVLELDWIHLNLQAAMESLQRCWNPHPSACIAPSLCKLFNLSISTGTFPLHGNWGRITPIPKGTN